MRSKKLNIINIIFVTLVILLAIKPVMAADLPLAAGSPLVGISFDDRPLLLPVQRNFQMAMLTASSEIGRSCGKMESYGWRMAQSEQQRVNLIFNNTVDRLRALGYIVETEAPRSVSRDVTLFTADRPDRHFIFMWSAGEIGLVMALCESSANLREATKTKHMPMIETYPTMRDVVQSKLEAPPPISRNAKAQAAASHFSPVGDWIGDYTCMQGVTGATLHITSMKGQDFQGIFRFYPTSKNRYVAKGSYAVYGQYDAASHRILINPGKWIERPKNYYNTIIVGSFDPASRTFSGFFQGIMGCTSFEAKYSGQGLSSEYKELTGKASASTVAKKKAKPKKKTAPTTVPTDSVLNPANAPGVPPASDGIKLPDNSATPTAAPAAAPPAPPVSTPAAAPAAPAPTPAPTTTAPAATAPAAAPAVPMPVPASPPAPKPTSMLDKKGWIVLALNQYNTNVPQLPRVQQYNTTVPQISQASRYNTTVPEVTRASEIPLPQHAPQPNYVAPSVPEVAQVTQWPLPQEAPGPSYYSTSIPQIQRAPQLPPPQIYTDP